ncbi:hypothetical protein [Thermodesulfobium narugense]|uniref:hypothetical protein n=1 Tax=Thermodesulfobium narugense TaxID=184064 RepID=UPI001FE0C6BB|nr:hypothetical protein [Thermodesulfobium narugense]
MQKDIKKQARNKKDIILDELIALTGYNRSYASFLLSSHEKIVRMNNRVLKVDLTMKKKKKKSKYYDDDVKKALIKVWDVLDCPCGKRLKPVLPEIIYKLKEFKEIQIERDVEEKLFKISASTIDRILSEYKRMNKPKGKTYTKPGSLLKKPDPYKDIFRMGRKYTWIFRNRPCRS